MPVSRSPSGPAKIMEAAPPYREGNGLEPAARAAGRTAGTRALEVSAWPAPLAAGVCTLAAVLISLVDLTTGTEMELAPYYFLPIILASLRFHRAGGLSAALASAVLSTWLSPVAMSRWAQPRVFIANTVTHALMYSFVALVTSGLQRQREHLRRQQAALQQTYEMQADLRAAAALQRHLVSRPLPEIPELELAAEIRFARGVGGDFYDLRRIGPQLAICIADVSGKGARAALISAALRMLLDETSLPLPDPMAFLRHLNARLVEDLPEEMFVTMFYAQLDPGSGELRYASAGHDTPFLCRGESVQPLAPTAPALGLMPVLEGETARVTLGTGDTLLLYTDGLTTAREAAGGRVGEERVVAHLREGTAAPLVGLLADLLGLAGSSATALEDDIAVIVLRLRPRRA